MKNDFIFIGDSITSGFGLPKKQTWVYNISNILPFNIINVGINGDTTTSMLDRFSIDVTIKKPDYIFIMGGTNDLLCGHSVLSITRNISEMIDEGLISTKNIFVGIPPCIIKTIASKLFMPSSFYSYCEDSLPILRQNIIELCNLKSVKFIDFYNLTLENIDKKIFLDGIHLNFPGNTLLLNEALKAMNFVP